MKIFKNKKISLAILFTLLMMVIYSLGRSLVIPGLGVNNDFGASPFAILSLLTGGNLEQFSLFSLGVGPSITAGIIIELMSMDVIPYLVELKEQGNRGRIKLNKITLILSVILAVIQSFMLIKMFDKQQLVLSSYILPVVLMTVGSLILQFIGNQITQRGVGNGVSMIILFGILLGMPNVFRLAYTTLISQKFGYVLFAVYALITLFITYGVVRIYGAERRIPITYAGKKLTNGSNMTYLPIRPSTVSVLPLIFANSIITAPLIILSYIKYDWYTKLSKYLIQPHLFGLILLASLIIIMGLVYGLMQLDPVKISKNISKNGGFIPNIRQGKETVKYLRSTIIYTLLVGIMSLIILVIVPSLMSLFIPQLNGVTFGGTSVILIVAIVSELVQTIESKLKEDKYSKWIM